MRREAADAHHDQVALFTGGDHDFLQRGGLLEGLFALGAFQQTDGEAFAAMRGNKSGHVCFLSFTDVWLPR